MDIVLLYLIRGEMTSLKQLGSDLDNNYFACIAHVETRSNGYSPTYFLHSGADRIKIFIQEAAGIGQGHSKMTVFINHSIEVAFGSLASNMPS